MLKWTNDGTILDEDSGITTAHEFLTSKFWNRSDTNQIIPISKHVELE